MMLLLAMDSDRRTPATLRTVHGPAGVRQDHRTAPRSIGGDGVGGALRGWRFFAEDEDEFRLEDMLQVRPRGARMDVPPSSGVGEHAGFIEA